MEAMAPGAGVDGGGGRRLAYPYHAARHLACLPAQAFIVSDFSLSNVARNSNPALPIIHEVHDTTPVLIASLRRPQGQGTRSKARAGASWR